MPTELRTDDPVDLARLLLKHTHHQKTNEVMRALFRPNSKVAVKGCNASGKTFMAADCVLLTLILGGDVLTTAPTGSQVEGVLWPLIRRSLAGAVFPTTNWVKNLTQIKLPTGEVAEGRSTDQGVRLQGYHARPGAPLLIVVDEAPGVIGDIMDAIGGISAGGDVRLLLLGNPIVPSGPFFEIFEQKPVGWDTFTISAFDLPNCQGQTIESLQTMTDAELDTNPMPFLATRRWVRDTYLKEGATSPYYQSHVLADFPTESTETLIARSWVDAAADRIATWDADGPEEVTAGVDVAGPGEDETVIIIQQGGHILDLFATPAPDSRHWAIQMLRPWLAKGLSQINIDEAGNGYYFKAYLAEQLSTLPTVTVTGINVGQRASNLQTQERHANLKAELYWSLREKFRDGLIAGCTDPLLRSQLIGIRYSENTRRRVTIESKQDARRRGDKSPDRAEALMLSMAPTQKRDHWSRLFQSGGGSWGRASVTKSRSARDMRHSLLYPGLH